MIDRHELTGELARQVTRLEDDLRTRADTVPKVAAIVEAEWRRAHDAGRTAHDLPTWRESLLTQVAVAWVLGTTFLRFCEDTGLLPSPVLTGPGDRARRAEDAQRAWFREHPSDGERGYVTHAFRAAAGLPGLAHVFEPHNPVWQFGPSDDGVRVLLTYWREVVPETGALRRDFTDPDRSTRFLGDLYQDLSESARKQYALLQTPDFVEEFILDRTLEPAIDEFGLDGFRMIDPACGSGHFLLGSFDRLLAHWRKRAPQEGDRALAERALRSIHGVDLNPFAAAIARFRLLVAALQAAAIRTLAEAPRFTIHVAVGDSLLHGPPPGQQMLADVEASDPARRHLFATEDAETIHQMLSGGYDAVVANPPYITPKDPAANAAYRQRYATCHRQYHLSVPFLERLFDLAVRGAGDRPAGFVGLITDNAFMKREFGKLLIEQFLVKQVDLTHIVDTESLNIGGHGTATVILFGRNRTPAKAEIRTVLGLRGDTAARTDPPHSQVWLSITEMIDRLDTENDYVSVVDLRRDSFAKHPWSLQGGGAGQLKALIEDCALWRLGERSDIGFGGITGEDSVFNIGTKRTASRLRIEKSRPFVEGDVLRDWMEPAAEHAIWPYDDRVELLELSRMPHTARVMWPTRRNLQRRKRFGTPMEELGLSWWSWRELYSGRLRTPFSIGFAFVATHNHFVYDRGAKVFKQSAPIIKLPPDANEDRYLALIGLLNSAVACFWMKQVFYCKGAGGVNEGFKAESWERFYEFDGTKLKQFPIPHGSVLAWAQRLDDLASKLHAELPAALVSRQTPSRCRLKAAQSAANTLRAQMIATQEELDWRCLHLFGVTAEDLSLLPGEAPAIERGQRAFEIVLARRVTAGDGHPTWFTRHSSKPITELPEHWPERYKRLVERRIKLIERDRLAALVERPEYKGRWNWDAWDDLEREALHTWLADRLEDACYWPDLALRSAAQLADDAARDPDFVQVAELYASTVDVDLTILISSLVKDEAVAYLAAWRYTQSGLRTRAAWERTWALSHFASTCQRPVPTARRRLLLPGGGSWTVGAGSARRQATDSCR